MAKLIASQKRKREKGGGTFAHEMRGDRGTSEQLFQGRIGSVPTRGGKGREKLFLSCKSGEALEGRGGLGALGPNVPVTNFFLRVVGRGGRTKRGGERKPSAPKWGGKLRERRREWGKGEKTHGRSREQEEEKE